MRDGMASGEKWAWNHPISGVIPGWIHFRYEVVPESTSGSGSTSDDLEPSEVDSGSTSDDLEYSEVDSGSTSDELDPLQNIPDPLQTSWNILK